MTDPFTLDFEEMVKSVLKTLLGIMSRLCSTEPLLLVIVLMSLS
jgi:hypothetical protein